MGILQEPTDTVAKLVSLPRWQREWINSRKSINFSGLAQEVIIELMRAHDPEYFQRHLPLIDAKSIMRKDAIENIVKRHPEIVPKIC